MRVQIRKQVDEKKAALKMKQGDKQVWIKQWDPTNNAYYFYNCDTGDAQWEQPPEYVEGATDETVTAVLKIQCMYRARNARRKVERARKGKEESGLAERAKSKAYGELSYVEAENVEGEWVEQYDPNEGRPYYWNSRTGEASWDKPEGFVEGGKSQNMAAALKIQSAFRGNKVRGC